MHGPSPESRTITVESTPDSGAGVPQIPAPLSDPHLAFLIQRRQQAAQACTEASRTAQEANQTLSDYLIKRLRAGCTYTQLRQTLVAANINHNSITRLMRAAGAKVTLSTVGPVSR